MVSIDGLVPPEAHVAACATQLADAGAGVDAGGAAAAGALLGGEFGAGGAVMTATSMPIGDWKYHFPHGFVDSQPWGDCREGEPAVVPQTIQSIGLATKPIRTKRGVSDDPVYVQSSKAAPGLCASSNRGSLLSENARLAMENEMLRRENLQLTWGAAASAAADGGLGAAYWWDPSHATPMDAAMMAGAAGLHLPAYAAAASTWCSGGATAAWQWSATLAQPPSGTRARTDSDIPARVTTTAFADAPPCGERGRTQSADETGKAQGFNSNNESVPQTTLMLRNVPTTYSRAVLLELLRKKGFGGQFDFVYLPMDFKSHNSLGYAFVNLRSAEQATHCWEAFDGYRWEQEEGKHEEGSDGDATCNVSWSCPYQGLEAHVERYRNSPIMHDDMPDDYKPAVFDGEKRVPFPPPTKKLKAPRVRPPGGDAASTCGMAASVTDKQQKQRSEIIAAVD